MLCWPRLLLLSFVLVAAGCTERPADAPLFVGHVASHSGTDRSASDNATRGIRLALKEANADLQKGVGRVVKVREVDTLGNLDAFQAEAVRLVAVNRVVALLGGATLAEVERLDRGQVPVVSPTGLRSRSLSDNVFLTGLAASQQGQWLARFTARGLGAGGVGGPADEARREGRGPGRALSPAFS